MGQTTPGDTAGFSAYRFFDSPIDPDVYLVRPGDLLRVTFVGTQIASLTLPVDPEGRIVHSNLGSFDLGGATLTEVREKLKAAFSRLYHADEIVVSATMPQRVGIQVSGSVGSPGLHLAYTSQRVSEIIDSAGAVLRSGSRRSIRLIGGPKEIQVDLDRAEYLGEPQWNPSLYAGHTVIVPPKSDRIVNVVGEVVFPREVEFVAGETVASIIRLAGGFEATADSANIRVIRGAEQLAGMETTLAPGDIVLVPIINSAAGDAPVTIFGAVARPGRYALSQSGLLSELVTTAGGFASNAAATELTVFRQVPREAVLRAGDRYPITNLVTYPQEVRAFTLQPGDSVFAPITVGYVKVSGEVYNPGMFPFEAGRSAAEYVKAAGGFLPAANQDKIEVFHRVSRATEPQSVGVIVHDGDEIIVRRREDLR